MPDVIPDTKPKTPQARREYFRAYYNSHKEYYKTLNAAWWKSHPEKQREKWRRRHYRKRDQRLEKSRLRRLENVEKYRATNRAWQRRRWTYRQQYTRDWNKRNRVLLRPKKVVAAQKRRAIKHNATINERHIKDWMLRVRAERMVTCHWCQKRVSTTGIHFDHIVPLVAGGEHSLRNLCVSCNHCNLSKGARSLKDWDKMSQTFLDL